MDDLEQIRTLRTGKQSHTQLPIYIGTTSSQALPSLRAGAFLFDTRTTVTVQYAISFSLKHLSFFLYALARYFCTS